MISDHLATPQVVITIQSICSQNFYIILYINLYSIACSPLPIGFLCIFILSTFSELVSPSFIIRLKKVAYSCSGMNPMTESTNWVKCIQLLKEVLATWFHASGPRRSKPSYSSIAEVRYSWKILLRVFSFWIHLSRRL